MRGFWIIGLVLLTLPFASAELLFSQPQAAYNFGDELSMTLTLRPLSDTTDFATIDLTCGSEHVTMYQSLLTIQAGTSREIALTPRLDSPLFANLNGSCVLQGTFGNDNVASQRFVLTKEITTQLVIPSTLVMPGSSIAISGTAQKVNGAPLEGFVRFSIDDTNFSYVQPVTEGVFSFNVTLPNTIAPGEHEVRVVSYEENTQGRVLNEGTESATLIVQVVLTRAEVVLGTSDANVGTPFVFTIYAYDQAGNRIERDAQYDIFGPGAEDAFLTRLTQSSVSEQFNASAETAPGYWRIEARVGDVRAKKLFYVNEFEKLTFTLENNDTLVITNEGNVPYHRSVQIDVGTYSAIKDVTLGVGEFKRFRLKAPDAAYDILVNDGNHTFRAMGVPLTGRAIDIGEVSGSFFNLWWAGLFVLVILGLTFVTNRYVAQRRAAHGKSDTPLVRSSPTRVLSGAQPAYTTSREPATMIAVRADCSSARVKNALDSALSSSQRAGAHILQEGDNHLITLSPRLTKKLENDLFAVTLAKEIEGSLVKNSIDFGIGVGKGEIISDGRGKGSFTSLGTLVPSVKRLARASKNAVLVSEDVHAALRTSIKAEKQAEDKAWHVTSVVNRDTHIGFINSFLKRTK